MEIRIDGKNVRASEGQTILEAARAAGIYIPSLCWYPRTGRAGVCRACVVEIQGVLGLREACAFPVREGMVVRTDTQRVLSVRRLVVELLLSRGRHDCLSCDAAGRCELQDMAYHLGIERPSFLNDAPGLLRDDSSPGILREPDKCILCGRCVAACNETVIHEVLEMGWRGGDMKILCGGLGNLESSGCAQCGECVQVCPTGALAFKPSLGQGRSWEISSKRVVCPYCGVGCVLDIGVRDNRWIWSRGREKGWESLPNRGMLCVKGRFGLDFLNRADRLDTPLIRRSGALVPCSWDEALDYVADRLAKVRSEHGARALGFLSSAKCTNEENYALMRLARGVLGTNNIDHCARLCHASTVAAMGAVFGSGAMTNSMRETEESDVILVAGANPAECHPVLGSMIRRAVKRKGVRLIVVDPRDVGLAECATIHLRPRHGTDVALLMGMQHIIVREGWQDREFIASRCEGYNEYESSLAAFDPETVERITGIPREKLFETARLYATSGRAAIYFAMGLTQHTCGVDNVKACANLALITGNIGVPGGGVNPLRGQSNVQGACDMGALPNVFSGYRPVSDPKARADFASAWGIQPESMDPNAGMTATAMIEACGESLRALYVMGENPLLSDPNLNHAEKCLGRLELLVVQDIFLTETARMADVVLPGAAFAEKSGTYTNTERRVQLSLAALEAPAGARADHAIIADLASRLGARDFPDSPEALFGEMRALTPQYRGMTWERLGEFGLQWPCPDETHPGTPILHEKSFTRGKALLSPLVPRPPAEATDGEYPLVLSTGRALAQYHTGTMSRRSVVLDRIVPRGYVELHPVDAERYGLADGGAVTVSTRRGSVQTRARVTARTPEGSLFMPFHFAEAAANRLTNDALDPIAAIPEFKVCAARIQASDPEKGSKTP